LFHSAEYSDKTAQNAGPGNMKIAQFFFFFFFFLLYYIDEKNK